MESKRRLKPWMVAIAAALAAYFSMDLASRILLYRQNWFDSWEYTTRKDAKVGYRLRPGVTNRFSGVPVRINADGFRTGMSGAGFSPKTQGEILVLVAGDSNTFGAMMPYDGTYVSLLERRIQAVWGSRVRVLNLGVPGYSTAQIASTMEASAYLRPDVVIMTVNTFNDRVFVGRPDSEETFRREFRSSRPYEFGDFISYPVLYWYRRHSLRPRKPDLSAFLPDARVPIFRYQSVLSHAITFAKQHAIDLVFLDPGDPADSPWSDQGLAAIREGRWEDALADFTNAQIGQPPWFVVAYYRHLAALQLGRTAEAAAIAREFHDRYDPIEDPYLLNLCHFSSEYSPIVREVASESGVPVVDLREPLRRANAHFAESHFDEASHGVAAAELEPVVESLLSAHGLGEVERPAAAGPVGASPGQVDSRDPTKL